ncbi:MAG: translation initiation factor IF-2 [Thermoflavifilum sp.]|uniref:translation initiation factor IF-2 n=1 Tax=Thermoflavifilum sp. TaxID=1968839 RepID=UPI0018A40697|nr:translation initiation factor IF-2 [Thermoflavifilum sp.]QOR76722.1 MAG: translation initiation factor IF-2 [Thermoflavifilum sp.]
MPEKTNTPRLLAAAKEFNIGRETLIEFLTSKGFDMSDMSANSRLTEEMYLALQEEFQQDKVNKKKSEQIDLPRGIASDILPKKETLETPAPETPTKITAEKPEAEEEILSAEAPRLEGPKIVGKIDPEILSPTPKSKKSTRSSGKKTKEPAAPQPASEPVAEVQASAEPEPETPTLPSEPEKSPEPVIENIEAERLTGPKIIGKIDLPVEPERKEKDSRSTTHPKEKRKRKRIPVEKKVEENIREREEKSKKDRRDHRYRDRKHHAPEKEIIDEKEIQEKIKDTLAKLSATSHSKTAKSKYRRAKREEQSQQSAETSESKVLQVTEFVSVSELANLMDVSYADVISKCMSLGLMVSINQRLDAEVIELVANEFGYEVEFIGLDEQEAEEEEEEIVDDEKDLVPRPPIVTIMGHVDHGKTSLLDYIRNTNVIAGEAGGITQHIGAYEVSLPNGKKITFLDTPGHEAFTAMRARGATVGDIAVIVIAADDAVMPQTREAISHAQAAGLPMIFAINKIDKEGANPDKIKEQLAAMNLLVEDWGGKYQSQEISAKQGLHVDLLLEKILLEAELLDLKANPKRPAIGTVIEASLDKGRGYVATLLVQNGTLHPGDVIVAGAHYGRVKAMFNERGQRIQAAGPSTPVQVLGLDGAPQAGEKFKVYTDESEAKEIATRRAQILREQGMRARKHITLDEIGRRLALGTFKELNLIIKGDVDGSVEALSDALQKLSTEEIVVNVVHKAVGQITESDVLLASASDAIIVGFQVRPSMQAARLAEKENIEIRTYSVIYDAIEEIKSAMEGMLEPKIEEKVTCRVEVKQTFKFEKNTVAGCVVLEGKLTRNTRVHLIREGIVIYTGELGSLKRFKDDVKEVPAGMECGLTIKNYNDIKVGDMLEGFEEVSIKRKL